MRFNKYTRRIDQHAFSSIIHFQLIDDCEIREFETYELNSALIQYRVQGTITIHATASLIYAERIISRVIRGWHSVNRRRVPSIIHRRASVTRMGLGSFVLSISLEHSPGNLCIIEPEAQSPCTRTATDTRRCYNEIVLARLKHCPSSCRLS